MTRPFFIDTDTASDDAVALVMALRHPDVEVVGISVVAGNVALDQAVQNALYTVELCGATVPVHAGAERPLKVPLGKAENVHGHDGMGDIGLDLVGRSPTGQDAVDALLEASRTHDGELTLVTIGPLTNIAHAVERDQQFPSRLARCVVMGAVADHVGNTTPVAEYNMWADPHAVEIVLDAELPLELVGWDVSRRYAVIDSTTAAQVRAIGTPLAEFCVDINRCVIEFCAQQTKLDGFDLPDPIAMAVAIDPAVATETRRLHCTVETESKLTRGMVVMDVLELTGEEPNATVVTAADRNRFLQMLTEAVS